MGRQRREFTPEYVTRSGVGEAETDPDEPFVAVVGDPGLDPHHGASMRCSKMPISAQCPQTLPRKPENLSEGRRKLNVGLTCDFTLTVAHSRGECEVVGESDTAPITQRSQVQILPPLHMKVQVKAGFVGHHGPGSRFACQHGVC
jgi:hypothetical protein